MQAISPCRRVTSTGTTFQVATRHRGRQVVATSKLSGWVGSDLLIHPKISQLHPHHPHHQRRAYITSPHANHVKGPFGSFAEQYDLSLREPETYWRAAAEKLEWFQRSSTILDYDPVTNPHFPKWFPDGLVNLSYNCLDVHVNAGRGAQDALIYDSPVTGVKQRYTYQELLDQVSTLAGAMQDLGVEMGDRVGECVVVSQKGGYA